MSLTTQVYKWILANLLNAGDAIDYNPIQGGEEILLVASCSKNRDKLRSDMPLGSYANFTLFLKYINFHFCDFRVLASCQKCVSILTGWALVRVVQAYRAVVRIWCTDNTKTIVTSKWWPIIIVAIDSISSFSSYQRNLCWWQTAWVDKTEQERAWCFSVNSSTYAKQKYLINNQSQPQIPFVSVCTVFLYVVSNQKSQIP